MAGCSIAGLGVVVETPWVLVSGGVEDRVAAAGCAGGAAGSELCRAPALTERTNAAEKKHIQRFMLVTPPKNCYEAS